MSNIGQSSNKPSFLFLRRDKDDFFEFGEHKTFENYVNKSESFKTFRELNLFSTMSGYQLSKRPSKTKPFSIEVLKELIDVIFTLNKNSSKINKDGNRFIAYYHELDAQFHYINKYGMLSLGTQIILEHEILQWFLFDDEDQINNEKKMLLYAQKHDFSKTRINEEFEEAINKPNFVKLEQNGIIDTTLKQQLIENKDVMLECLDEYRDKLNVVGAVPKLTFGVAPGIVSVVAGVVTGLAVDAVASVVSDTHEFGTYTRKGGQIGVKIGKKGMVIAKGIENGVEASIRYWNKNYSRYQIRSKNSFAVKIHLASKQALPMFVNSPNEEEKLTHYVYDHHLLSLISLQGPIVLFIAPKTVNISTLLNKISNSNMFVESEQIKIPLVIHHGGFLVNMPPWNDDLDSKKMFYSLYCLVDVIIWNDTTMKSEDFESFQKVLAYEMNYCEQFTRKPSFIYTLHGSKLYCDTHMKKHNSFSSFRNMNLFSSISGYNLPDNEPASLELFCHFIGKHKQNARQRVAFYGYPETGLEGNACPNCSKIWTKLSGTQCEHCGDFNFNQQINNVYSLYRQLLYIDKYNKLSIELQLIMDDEILKYFLYEEDDEYQERLMWQFAKMCRFNKNEICELFEACEPQNYINFYDQLMTGKELFIFALSSETKEWMSPFLSPPITLDKNQNSFAVYGFIRKIKPLLNPHTVIRENIFKLCCFYFGVIPPKAKVENDYFMVKDYFDNFKAEDQNVFEENKNMNQSAEAESLIQISNVEKLVNMGFVKNEAINALQITDNNLETAIQLLVQTKDDEKQNQSSDHENMELKNDIKQSDNEIKLINEQQKLSPEESAINQMQNFLKRIRLQSYADKFKEDDCYDIESIILYDDESLKEDIGMKRTARKRFLMHSEKIKNEMNEFANNYGISTILYNRLATYGIVTMDILCNEVKGKLDLKNKFKISNQHQCNLLWNLVEKQENCNPKDQNDVNIKSTEGADTQYIK